MDQPGVIRALWSISRVLITVRGPIHRGSGTVDHSDFGATLEVVAADGGATLSDHVGSLRRYAERLGSIDPTVLSRDEALAYWINLYNAGALALAGGAQRRRLESVLRVPGAFSKPFVSVGGKALSLDAIEHAKIRRFRDPRIHSALVCGSVSCPTMRSDPYVGPGLDQQLEDQMRSFLSDGASRISEAGSLELSRVFLWYGSDFVRPNRMPTLVPAPGRKIAEALAPWLPEPSSAIKEVVFQSYDWGLRCSVGS